MSTSTVVAPSSSIGSTLAMNVCGVVITSSPAPMPSACSARKIAAVPLATADAALGLLESGEGGFKVADFLAADEAGVVDDALPSPRRSRP